MHPRTRATLKQLEEVEWFARVGLKDSEQIVVLSSWQEAVESCSSLEWENLCLEAANQFCERLVKRSPERFDQWNEIALAMKDVTIPFVLQKIEKTVKTYDLSKVFEATVQWDILHLCMEAEYADVFPPAFYTGKAYWYLVGRFQCGWQGSFPAGKPIIY